MEIKLMLKSNNKTLEITENTSYKLVNIDGIERSNLELNTVSNAQFDGSVVVGRRIQNRPISITVDYKGENKEIERQKLISFFNPKNKGVLIAEYGGIERAIEYEIEDFNCKLTNIHDDLSFTVDLICPNPYWRNILESKINIALWKGMFKFPLIMPSTVVPHVNPDSTWKDLSGNLNNGLLSGFNYDTTSGWTTEGLKFDNNSYVTLPSLDLQEGTIQVNNQVVKFDKKRDYATDSANSNIVSLNTIVDGIIEDLQIKGRTLQNLFKSNAIAGSESDGYWYRLNTHPITDLSGKTVTLINTTSKEIQFEIRDLKNVAIRYEVIQPFGKKTIMLEANRKVYAIIGKVLNGWTEANKAELKGMILEGDYLNKEISPYFEGIRSVAESGEDLEVVSCGKNLFKLPTSITGGGVLIDGGIRLNKTTGRTVSIKLPKSLTPNTTYTFSCITKGNNTQPIGVKLTKSGSTDVNATQKDGVYTLTTKDASMTHIYLYLDANDIDNAEVDILNIQLEKETTSTIYEQYQEHKQLIPVSDFRSLPNGVTDVVDFNTKKVIRNVDKIVLDDNTNNYSIHVTTSELVQFRILALQGKRLHSPMTPVICSHFPYIGGHSLTPTNEGIYVINSSDTSFSGVCYIAILKSKLATPDVAGFVKWLQANPVTVYYQLATPVISQLSQEYKLKSFAKGTLQVNTLISPDISVRYPITLAGSIASNVSRIDLSNPLITDTVKNYRVYDKILTTEEIARANTSNYLRGPSLLLDLNSSYKELAKTGIIMGLREPSLIVNVLNTGDVESGMIIEFKALGTLKNPSLLNVNTGEFLKINKSMVSGEIIKVNTNVGNKKVIKDLNGIETNILNLIDLDSTFLQLNVGDNLFRYNADENLNNLEISIYYNPYYLGV